MEWLWICGGIFIIIMMIFVYALCNISGKISRMEEQRQTYYPSPPTSLPAIPTPTLSPLAPNEMKDGEKL
jgi:hypothetical protein